jgi:3-phenylpropionate/trans-cinnamate dioxygenase ferredoxin subunit
VSMVSSDSWHLTPDSWIRVLQSAELPAGGLAKVVVEGEPVLLARLEDGTVAAASAVCPHRGEDLSGGHLYMGAIDCPLHHYLYDLRTGVNRYPRNVFPADLAADVAPLPLYPVKEEDGWICVQIRMKASEG